MIIRILARRCVICGKKKPNTRKFWNLDHDTPERLNDTCRRCEWQRRYRAENKDKVAEQQRRYRAENKDKVAEQKRQYYQQNKDRLAEQKRRYRAENKDRLAEQQRQYYQQNKRKRLVGLRPVRSLEEQAVNLRTLYGKRTVAEALGIGTHVPDKERIDTEKVG